MAFDGIKRAVAKFGASGTGGVIGALVGVGAGSALGNPIEGSALGALAGSAADRVGTEIVEWWMSPRQERRAGSVYTIALQKLREELDRGAVVRDDGFFRDVDGRSPADEVFEEVIRAAMDASQERKISFIGTLWARIAVNSRIEIDTAHLLIDCARTLSFRGYALLKFAAEKSAFALPARGNEQVPGPPVRFEPLMIEVYDLATRGLLVMKDREEDVDMYAIIGHDEIDPSKLFLSTVGRLLYDNLGLNDLSIHDVTYRETVDGLQIVARSGKGRTVIDGGSDGGLY